MSPRRSDAGMAASNNGWVKKPRAKAKGLKARLVRAVAALKPRDALDSYVRQRRRPEDEAAPGCVFEGDLRLHDLRIFLERGGESGIEGDGLSMSSKDGDEGRENDCLL